MKFGWKIGAAILAVGIGSMSADDRRFMTQMLPIPFRTFRPPQGLELDHVSIVIRHGMRTPVNNAWGDETEWDCGGHNSLSASFHCHDKMGDEVAMNALYPVKQMDSHSPMLRGNCFPGQLTRQGWAQHISLGSYLR